jgi:hypothetical protein
MEEFSERRRLELPLEARFHAACALGQTRAVDDLMSSAKKKKNQVSGAAAARAIRSVRGWGSFCVTDAR